MLEPWIKSRKQMLWKVRTLGSRDLFRRVHGSHVAIFKMNIHQAVVETSSHTHSQAYTC